MQQRKTTECPDVFRWDSDVKRFMDPSAIRCPFVCLVTNPSDETWWLGRAADQRRVPYLARVPALDYSKGEVRLGLLTKAGRGQSTVPVGFRRVKERTGGTERSGTRIPELQQGGSKQGSG